MLGNGQHWWHWKQLQQDAANRLCFAENDGIPVERRVFGTEQDALRPSFIQPIRCRQVLIEGITVSDGPQWTLHPVYSENVIIRGVHVITNGHNTDGLNPDSCRNVLIEDSIFETGDDCIAINSGMNEDGWRVNKPCENIVIRNCTMKEGHGGLVIGSGMSGGVRNIYAHNCKIAGGDRGIRIKSMRGRGGYIEDVWFENIEIRDVREEAVQINMFYEYSTVVPRTDTPAASARALGMRSMDTVPYLLDKSLCIGGWTRIVSKYEIRIDTHIEVFITKVSLHYDGLNELFQKEHSFF